MTEHETILELVKDIDNMKFAMLKYLADKFKDDRMDVASNLTILQLYIEKLESMHKFNKGIEIVNAQELLRCMKYIFTMLDKFNWVEDE